MVSLYSDNDASGLPSASNLGHNGGAKNRKASGKIVTRAVIILYHENLVVMENPAFEMNVRC